MGKRKKTETTLKKEILEPPYLETVGMHRCLILVFKGARCHTYTSCKLIESRTASKPAYSETTDHRKHRLIVYAVASTASDIKSSLQPSPDTKASFLNR